MKLLLGIALALWAIPAAALDIDFDNGMRVSIDKYSVRRIPITNTVTYSQVIQLDDVKAKSYGAAHCDRNIIEMSYIKYYTADDIFLDYEKYERIKINVKPGTMYDVILDTVCQLESYEQLELGERSNSH